MCDGPPLVAFLSCCALVSDSGDATLHFRAAPQAAVGEVSAYTQLLPACGHHSYCVAVQSDFAVMGNTQTTVLGRVISSAHLMWYF